VDVGVAQGTDICFGFLPESIQHNITAPNNHQITVSGPGVGEVLNRSVALPAGYGPGAGGPDNRPILAGRPLDVWETLRAEAAARSASGIVMPPWFTFGGGIMVTDSAGVAWGSDTYMNIVFEIRSGTGLFDVMKWSQSFGGFNFLADFQGRNPVNTYMFVYQGFRKDVSGKVGLHLGRHILSADKTESRESVMSHMYSSYTSAGTSRINTISNGDAMFKYGKREFFWSDASDYSFTDAEVLANKLANSKRAAPLTTTLEINPNVDFNAFIDYDVFDRITYDNSELGIRGPFTVMGIAVEVTEDNERQQVLLETPIETFNRRLYAESNRLQQRFKFNSRILQ